MIHKYLAIATLSLFLLPIIVTAQNEIRQESVQFKPGTTGTTIPGQIKGYETVDYILRAKAGQSMVVILNTDNQQNYFNVTPTGEETAIFIGSTSGNRFEGTLPKDGDYTVRVYLMRSAARENQAANYSIEIGIDGNQAFSGTNPTGPYTTDQYDATTSLKCEVRNSVDGAPVTHNQNCPAGILRGDGGSASIRIMLPSGVERVLNFEANNVTTSNEDELTWGKEDDTWYIGINNQEFYIVPEAAILGD
ncbi:hypothetical protein [Gloeocapsa sp. PCC 73106]|uniref:hypothetical protein n=1 Tax=Gloeocapsa sp. PCC 73106 TaxID=102232 RepID=UPI0002AC244A|nr:hypothetical protein [Gloeocapsa sp. PCC 73106]ELR99069.1 hypothetical protein GLO73106DRAFT_00029150 [Gloeocapsa sp. PCC 73106]